MILNKQFKLFRQNKKINQSKLSKMSGVGRHTIWRFEKGNDIKLSSFEKLIDCLDSKVLIIDKNL